jgi:hypothetical protein
MGTGRKKKSRLKARKPTNKVIAEDFPNLEKELGKDWSSRHKRLFRLQTDKMRTSVTSIYS